MSTDSAAENDTSAAPVAAVPPESAPAAAANSENDTAKVPEFANVNERLVKRLDANSELLHGVSVPVWAELGRIEMVIGDLLELGEGSVVRLDRAVGDPVDVIAQGVKLARGEVIVVDDHFAIRIREVLSGN